jgi:hypothetical protein
MCFPSVILYSGDLVRDKKLVSTVITPKTLLEPVTSLHYSRSGNSPPYALFVTYASKLVSYALPSLRPTELETTFGSELYCTTLTDNEEIVVGQDSGILMYL